MTTEKSNDERALNENYNARLHSALNPPGAPLVLFETTLGNVEVELYYLHAPKTAQNFFELAKKGYYDGLIFHRIIKDFMIQGGDPTGTGRGGESIFGAKFPDEITRDLKHTGAGILSMANSGKDTNGSQFFITLAPTPWLDGKHTIFGRVSKHIDTVAKLGRCKVGKNDRPIEDVRILRATADARGIKWY
jgi:peptidyl-prolyl cis-trans isomerase-like 1